MSLTVQQLFNNPTFSFYSGYFLSEKQIARFVGNVDTQGRRAAALACEKNPLTPGMKSRLPSVPLSLGPKPTSH